MMLTQLPLTSPNPLLQTVHVPADELLQIIQLTSLQLGLQYNPPRTMLKPEMQLSQAIRFVQLPQFDTRLLLAQLGLHIPLEGV